LGGAGVGNQDTVKASGRSKGRGQSPTQLTTEKEQENNPVQYDSKPEKKSSTKKPARTEPALSKHCHVSFHWWVRERVKTPKRQSNGGGGG